jgi:hypothetical protein
MPWYIPRDYPSGTPSPASAVCHFRSTTFYGTFAPDMMFLSTKRISTPSSTFTMSITTMTTSITTTSTTFASGSWRN